jgi:hypothetical protein
LVPWKFPLDSPVPIHPPEPVHPQPEGLQRVGLQRVDSLAED